MIIRIASWNIWTQGNIVEVERFLLQENLDLIALQEVSFLPGSREILCNLKKSFPYILYEENVHNWNGREHNQGLAIFSKLPFLDSSRIELQCHDAYIRLAMKAKIKIESGFFYLINTHLAHTHQKYSLEHECQTKNLLKQVEKRSCIVSGDLNANPKSNSIKMLSQILTDTDKDSQPTWSLYKEGCAVCQLNELQEKLDYIFITDDIECVHFEGGNSNASDHIPIVAHLKINGTEY